MLKMAFSTTETLIFVTEWPPLKATKLNGTVLYGNLNPLLL